MPEPDYTTYSLQDLRSVKTHIDEDRYPERLARALEELDRRATGEQSPEGDLDSPSDKLAQKRANRIFWGIILVLVLIGGTTVGVTSAKRSKEMQAARAKSQRGVAPVQAAIEGGFTAEGVQAVLEHSGGRRYLDLTLTNTEFSEVSEEVLAESIAIAAFVTFEKRRNLDFVRVKFATEEKKFLSSETETGDPFDFPKGDLRKHLE